jgi:hypothetical protein
VSLGEAITWENAEDEPRRGGRAMIVETLEHPNTVTVAASSSRMTAADGVGVLEPAVDAAQAVQARNSIEKMLAHQLAAAHHTAMRLAAASTGERLQPVDVVRLTNAAARMMDVYQNGCLALLKLKTKGKQRVVVQHVTVGAGGQAVVAGRLSRGSRKRGQLAGPKDEPHGT